MKWKIIMIKGINQRKKGREIEVIYMSWAECRKEGRMKGKSKVLNIE